MAYDGSIRINTKIDGKGFDTGVKRMMSSLGSLAASLGVVFGVAGLVNFGKKSVETAMQMEAGWQGLRYMARAYGKDINQISEFLQDYTKDGLVPMMNAQQAYKNMLARGYNTDQLEKMLLIMKDSAVYLRKGQLAIGDAIEKTTMGLRTERSILTDSSGIEKNMYKMWQAYAKEMGTTISALTKEQKLIAEFQGFMEEGAVYAGAAAEYTETYAGKVAQLTAAMVGLKVSVGNMLIPLLNAMLPKIIEIVHWFTRLFNIVGRVLNLLFGTNVGAIDAIAEGTEDAADAQDELANATDRAGKAAKGALASFDKLNVLSQPAPTSGGGGGTDLGLPEEEEDGGALGKIGKALDELEIKIAAFKQNLLAFFAPLQEPFNRLKEAFLTLGATIGTGLGWAWTNILQPFFNWLGQDVAPVALDLVTAALNLLNEVLIAVSPLFLWLWENVLQPIGKWAGEAFIQALTWISEKLTELSDWISTHQETVQTITTILGSFAAAWILVNGAIGIWSGIAAIATSVTTAFAGAVAFLTSPIGLVVLAIGAVIAIVVLLIKHWDDVKAWAISTWEKIKEVWGVVAGWFNEKVVEPLKAFFAPIAEWFSTNVTNPLKEKFANLVEKWTELKDVIKEKIIDPVVKFFEETLKPLIAAVLDFLKDYFAEVWEGIKDVISTVIGAIGLIFQTQLEFWKGIFSGVFEAIGGIIKGALQVITAVIGTVIDVIAGIITFLTGVFTGDWDKAWRGIKDIVLGIWDGIVGVIKGAINGIIGFINGMINGIVSGINNVIGVLNNLNIEIPDWIPLIGGKTFGFNLQTLTAPQIPLLATGAVIPANAPFAAILGDQKSGTNVEAPLKTIEQAVDNVLARRGLNTGTDNGLIHNVIKLDGQVLYDAFKKIDKRVGRSMIAGSGIR